jgi:Tol biopolymer transport system component
LTNTQESGSQLLSGRSDNGARGVAWSANGQILFTSSRSGKTELWAVQADGTRLRQLTENSGWSPAASSDGRWFVYVDGRMQLWRGSFDNTAPTLLTAASRVFHPMIDRDGRVHYDSIVNGQLKAFRLPHTGGAPEETSEHLFFPTDTLPNGDLLGAKWDEIQRSYVAAIKPAAGGSLRLLSHVLIQSPAAPSLRVTPDGALSFVQTEDGRREIWCQPIEKGPAVQLTHSEGDDIFAFAWSPDGKELVVSRGRTASDVVLIHRK